ncbi:hypothetical protein [Desulfovibrio intestinalis]|uniref:Uncharacterized protein n=1 Tax=Desulfovibrio intestinalis TaxID=58621 RepID=A0A7W8FDX0_9BACT|nr:hypothetical protein [Desulfovibrio intestinalis]MBB5142173.1 hypothetical protein [Desulfovibrio intestinalis]
MKSNFEKVVYYLDTDICITLDKYRDKSITKKAKIGVLEGKIIINFSADDIESQRFMTDCSYAIQENPYVDMEINGRVIRGFIIYTDTVFCKNHEVYIGTSINKLEINVAPGLCEHAILKFGKNINVKNIFKFSTLMNYSFHISDEDESNVIKIKKSDNSDIEIDEMMLFLNQIRYFISFLNGRFINSNSIELFDKNNERVLIQLFPGLQTKASHSVLTEEMEAKINHLFEKFICICDFESLKRVISMYLTVNSSRNIDLISSVIISKTAIEVLIDRIPTPSFISEENWEKNKSFGKIEKYLESISANVFLGNARELQALGACCGSTPFDLVNRIRNDLVHSEQKIIPDMDRSAVLLMETHTILLLFLEKIILNLLEYHGTYLQRDVSPMLAKEI